MTQPGLWLNPLILGDLKAGIESVPDLDQAGELGVGLVWFAAIPASQGETRAYGALDGLVLDGRDFGDWVFSAHVGASLREPDPAQARLFAQDGREILAVAQALEATYGADPIAAARRVAMAMMARTASDTGTSQWLWETPLGRRVRITARTTPTPQA